MIKTVSDYIAAHRLLAPYGKYLVALSGGADSVALLLVLRRLGYSVEAVHCNFHLRGDESDRDEHFVTGLCSRLGVVLHKVHFDTREYAAVRKQSIELAARNLRYGYFEQLRSDIGADGICVAHHRDDLVETVLMNIVRGTGIHGMVGIRPRNGYILRPLLCIGRSDIEHFLAEHHQDYVTDSTNLEDDATRNVFRHHVVPLLQSINPAAVENIAGTARLMTDVETIYNADIDRCRREFVVTGGNKDCAVASGSNGLEFRIMADRLLLHPVPSTVLYELLSPYGFSGVQASGIIASLAAGNIGKVFRSSGYTAVTCRDCIEVGKTVASNFAPMRLPVDGIYVINGGEKKINLEITGSGATEISRCPDVATLDADKVKFPLTLRRVENGDRFRPFGMKGSKLVSDFMTDAKYSYFEKQSQLVLLDSTGKIIWLVGRRTSDVCKVQADTKNILKIYFS